MLIYFGLVVILGEGTALSDGRQDPTGAAVYISASADPGKSTESELVRQKSASAGTRDSDNAGIYDLFYANLYASGSDTFLTLPNVMVDTGLPHCTLYAGDSSNGVHPSVLYNRAGFYGSPYKVMLAWTPYGICWETPNENIHVGWTDDDRVVTDVLDSTKGIAVVNPIYRRDDFPAADHLADPALYVDGGGIVHLQFIVTYGTDSTVIKDGYTCNGIDWSDPKTIWADPSGFAGAVMSPAPLFIGARYHLWYVRKWNTNDSTRVVHLISDRPDTGYAMVTEPRVRFWHEGLWSFDAEGVCDNQGCDSTDLGDYYIVDGMAPYDSANQVLYHLSVEARLDEIITWATVKNLNPSYDAKVIFGISYDGGSTWIMHDTVGSAKSVVHADSVGLDADLVYASSGYWIDDGALSRYRLYYTAGCVPVGGQHWHICVTDVYFRRPGDANADETVNVADAVFLICMLFRGGPSSEPLRMADINGDCRADVGDIVYLVNYIFKDGPSPKTGCAISEADLTRRKETGVIQQVPGSGF